MILFWLTVATKMVEPFVWSANASCRAQSLFLTVVNTAVGSFLRSTDTSQWAYPFWLTRSIERSLWGLRRRKMQGAPTSIDGGGEVGGGGCSCLSAPKANLRANASPLVAAACGQRWLVS